MVKKRYDSDQIALPKNPGFDFDIPNEDIRQDIDEHDWFFGDTSDASDSKIRERNENYMHDLGVFEPQTKRQQMRNPERTTKMVDSYSRNTNTTDPMQSFMSRTDSVWSDLDYDLAAGQRTNILGNVRRR